MPLTLIVHPDEVQRSLIRTTLRSSHAMEFREFDSDDQALHWSKSSRRPIDFLCTGWEISEAKRTFLKEFRSLPSTAETLAFVIGSQQDLDAVATLFHTPGILPHLSTKPFRPSFFMCEIQRILSFDILKKPCALIVDDQKEVCEVLHDYLREFGFARVIDCSNGRDALKCLEANPHEVSIVLSDWNMPDMNGGELLAKVRENPAMSRLPFVLVSSLCSTDRLKALLAARVGIDGYVAKPFNLTSFHAQLESLIQEISKQRKAEAYRVGAQVLLAKNSDKTEDTLLEGIKLYPHDSSLWEALGDFHWLNRHSGTGTRQACENFEKALKLSPLNTSLAIKSFEAYSTQGRTHEAVRVLRSHFKRFAFDEGLFTQLGKIFLRWGDDPSAGEYLRKAIAANPQNLEAQTLFQTSLLHSSHLKRGAS